MSGLLQRLVGQASRAQPTGASRIRPAISLHAHVDLGTPPELEGTSPVADLPSPKPILHTPDARAADLGQEVELRDPVSVAQPVGTPRSPTPRTTSITASRLDEHIPARVAANEKSRAPTPLDYQGRAPQPLLEETQAAASAPTVTAIAPTPSAHALTPQNSYTGTNEVHVHIGRVEVVAVPEAPAPKKNRAATRNSLPLADYLARRRRS